METLPLVAPRALNTKLQMGEAANCTFVDWYPKIRRILAREDAPLLVIAGPCLINDPEIARHAQDQGQYTRAPFPRGAIARKLLPPMHCGGDRLARAPGSGSVCGRRL